MAFTKINAAGIGTTETVTLDGLTVINDGSFGGNLTVGGVLTYEDVTNVDSVGLITARNGIVVGSGITLSKDGDIFATGITTISENLKVGSGVTISPDGDGFFTGVITATSYSGIDLSDVTGATGDFSIADKIVHTGDTDSAIRFSDNDQISLETGGNEKIRLNNTTYIQLYDHIVPNNDSTKDIGLTGTRFRAAYVDTYYGDGSNLTGVTGTTINSNADNRIITGSGTANTLNGEANLTYNGSNLALAGNDNQSITIGASADLTLKADGSNSAIVHNGDGDLVMLAQGTDENIKLQSAGYTHFFTGGNNERVRITSDGRVRIGYSTDEDIHTGEGADLQVVSNDAGGLTFARDDTTVSNGANLGVISAWGNDSNGTYQEVAKIEFQADLNHGNNDKPGRLVFSTTSDGGSSTTERMRLNSSGQLLLGATSYSGGGSSPAMYVVGTSGRQVKIYNTSAGTCALQLSNSGIGEGDDAGLMVSSLSDGQANISNAENNNLLFGTNNNTRLCIKGNGDMIFGGATSVEAQANITFEADRDDGSGRITFNRANTSNVSICIEMQNNNSQSGRIEYDNSSCGIFSSSDYRVKENDVAISDGISRVKQLRPIRFNFKAEPLKTVDGFFAHEVDSVVPEAVSGEKDAVDSDGNMITQGICKEKLVPLLTAALQEAIAKIETLETKVAALEG